MPAKKARVSLCMIVRDEEHNLAACLTPVAHLFDEIVIVDTGSRDKTREIARQFTPHVHEFTWCDDFAAARNESLRHATGDWICWLDADDRVRPEHVENLRALIGELDDRPRVFMMDTVIVPAAATSEEATLVTHPRLFRRHPDQRWQGRVHEQLVPEFSALGYEWIYTKIQIDHVGYQDRTVSERKSRRKLRLLRMDYAVNPDDPSTLLHLAMSLLHSPNNREAKTYLLHLVDLSLGGWAYMRWVYHALAELAITEGNPAEAARFAKLGLLLFPDDEHLLLAQAVAWYVMGNYAAAGQSLDALINGEQKPHMVYGAPAHVREKLAPRMLAAVQRMQKAYTASEATLQGLLRLYPDDLSSWYNLGLVYLDQGIGNKLAVLVRHLLTLKDGHIDAGLLAALWHLRYGDPTLAGPIIDQLIAEVPRLPRPRMLRAEWLSRCRAPIEAQIRALRDVLRLQPGNAEARHWLAEARRVQAATVQPAVSDWSTSVVTMPGVGVG